VPDAGPGEEPGRGKLQCQGLADRSAQ
jgi:hypothetical protein